MDIGIVTIVDYTNYGNRLQNYAVCFLLEELGARADNLKFYFLDKDDLRGAVGVKRRLYFLLPDFVADLPDQLFRKKTLERLREKRFQKFTQKYTRVKKLMLVLTNGDLEKLGSRYDLFVTGSDQVWNPRFAGDAHFFLSFAPPEKRIAFSASIGTDVLPEDRKEEYRRLLQNMRFISVREESAADLVGELTGRRPEVWLDPTLLLSREAWQKLAKKPRPALPERYILSFFLGEEPEEMLTGYAVGLGLPVVRMENKAYPQYYTLDPAEFLYLVEHAELVLTDSFHATVFSIKFHVPFFVFQRKQKGMEDMFTRIENLLGRFGLEDRRRERVWRDEYGVWQEVTEERYAGIEARIKAEREMILEELRALLAQSGRP